MESILVSTNVECYQVTQGAYGLCVSDKKRVDDLSKALATVLKKRREKAGFSMNRLAQEAGLVVQTISFIENGERRPNIETLARLAFALETTPSAILREAEKACKP